MRSKWLQEERGYLAGISAVYLTSNSTAERSPVRYWVLVLAPKMRGMGYYYLTIIFLLLLFDYYYLTIII